VNQKIDLAKLPTAKGAAFDSYMDQHEGECLPKTRTELRDQIARWAVDPQGKCIFWLNGMAGTGKSTISRTVAKSFHEKGLLGASFFFKRGEGDRGNAMRFFTTIATQLMVHKPELIPGIGKAIEVDPTISERALKEQFEKLILQPLSDMKCTDRRPSSLVIVIDALDECEQEEDVKAILRLLPRAKEVKSVHLRIFVTSRPELPIRLGFKHISDDAHQDVVLHEIPKATIERDITLFFEDKFAKIRQERSLSLDWPGRENIQALVEMAVPLFIFAATVCRFVADPRWDPKKRLSTILEYKTASQASKLDRTYLPVLDQLLAGQDEAEKDRLATEFREVVGAIIILASPLSIVSLSSLLGIEKEVINCRLELLHSVLNVPANENAPVRLLHLSFRDFLLDPQKRGKSPFWVDGREMHRQIARKCLELMSGYLRENICNLPSPGTLRTDIDSRSVDKCLPAEVQYACRYWVHHQEQSNCRIRDTDLVHVFLQQHLLHWLESLSLLGKISESIALIDTLQLLVAVRNLPT